MGKPVCSISFGTESRQHGESGMMVLSATDGDQLQLGLRKSPGRCADPVLQSPTWRRKQDEGIGSCRGMLPERFRCDMNSDKPRTNEHGAEVFSGSIFSWNEIDRVRFDEDRAEAQLITGEHMHLIRAVYEPGATIPCTRIRTSSSVYAVRPDAADRGRLYPGDRSWRWLVCGYQLPHGGEIIGDETVVFIDVYSPATRWILDIMETGPKLPRLSDCG
ncbi:MAG: hypothetical protein Ct9H300mP16_15830 [Pseudomonadota bacterium]|nr:MAG: hypothetical protein Ct9H300mP16_15830 [Pseudomonadota bacterium]